MLKQKILMAGVLGLLMMASAHAADVAGFRSAHFGANEKATIDAATADLGVKATDIQRTQDPTAKVTALTAKVKSFEPLNLPASVTYVLGYKCACLTQVNVVWELPDTITADQRKSAMVGVGALVEHLAARGWDKDEVVTNRVTGDVKEGSENALVFFHGQTKSGSAITLAGAPVKMTKSDKKDAKPDEMAANIDTVKSVLLTYEKDATSPDIYHVDVNGF